MLWRCGNGKHPGAAVTISNRALEIGRCARCCADLIRVREGRWRVLPAGYRVIWLDAKDARRTGLHRRHAAAIQTIARAEHAASSAPCAIRPAVVVPINLFAERASTGVALPRPLPALLDQPLRTASAQQVGSALG